MSLAYSVIKIAQFDKSERLRYAETLLLVARSAVNKAAVYRFLSRHLLWMVTDTVDGDPQYPDSC